jgi:hypothetical protein
MPAQLTYGTAGATGGGFANFKGLQTLFAEERLDVRPDWSWQRRSAKTWKDRNAWISCWPTSRFCGGGDAGQGYQPVGQGVGDSGMYEPYSCDGEGTQTKRFLRGITKDATLAVVANAIVQGFVTSTDAFVGEVTSGADGTYTLGTETVAGVQHYLVAYKAGSPDIAGTTVNTLTSTNVDGT